MPSAVEISPDVWLERNWEAKCSIEAEEIIRGGDYIIVYYSPEDEKDWEDAEDEP